MHITKTVSFLTILGGLAVSHAAPIAMTNATFTTPVDDQFGLVSFEAGGTTYTPSVLASTTLADATFGADGWNDVNGNAGEPSSELVAVNDVYITTNVFGLQNGSVFDLNTTVNDGDTSIFYITDFGAGDNITVTPFDAGGAIGSWTLSIAAGDFGVLNGGLSSGDTYYTEWNNSQSTIAGVTFALSDFTGGAGTLTGVTRLEINGAGNLDPSQVGVAAIPEPGTLALTGLALAALCLLRRRV